MTSSSSPSRTFSVCISFSLGWKIEDIKNILSSSRMCASIAQSHFYCAFVSVSMRDVTSRSACVSLPLTRIRTAWTKKKVKKRTTLCVPFVFIGIPSCLLCVMFFFRILLSGDLFFFGCWFLYPLCVSPIISGANNNLLLLFSYLIMLQSVGIPYGRFGQ